MEKTPESPKRSRFTIKESVPALPRIESGVPGALTAELLENFPAVEHLQFDSGKVEDFLISALEGGLTISEIEECAKASPLQDDIVQIQERSMLPEIESTIDSVIDGAFVERIKEGIIKEMENLGATDAEINAFKEVIVSFEKEAGTSMAGSKSVAVNVSQVLRKAFDAIQGLQMDKTELPRLIEIIMTRTIAHELGHTVDQVMGIVSNTVARDERWGPPEQSEENKSERFAEFVGVSQLDAEQAQLSQKERLLNVAKSAEMWGAIGRHNAHHSPKVGLDELFATVERTFDSASAKAFISSRRYLYSTARPENYAMPYTREKFGVRDASA